ncbi:GAF and ANTAR domain-containing protein [Blastococcus sp. SYSU DS0510]
MTGQGVPPGPVLLELVDRLAHEMLARSDPDDVLARAVELAVANIEGATSASITVLERRDVSTAAASGDLARAGDSLQYQLGEGPCLDAAAGAEVVHSQDVADDPRWPRWGPAAATDLGVRSMLSVQLRSRRSAWGSFNVYGRQPDAFDGSAIALAVSFAGHSAIAHARASDRRNLEAALVTRNLIGQAQGVLMERHKITADRAFEVLVATSQASNTKLVEIARRVIETGVSPPGVGR